jgi:hypothetical protein
MSELLSESELRELSGLSQGAAQAKFLKRAYGLNIPRRADGRVRVTWAAINHALTKSMPESSAARPRWTK